MKLVKTIARCVAGVAFAAGLVTAPAANAAPNGNIVTLGDSYTSNPDQVRNELRNVNWKPIQD